MQKMTLEELTEHVERLVTEAGHIERKLAQLQEVIPPPADRINMLQKSLHRLKTLEQMARDRLEGRPPRDEPSPERGHRPRSGPPRASSRPQYERGGGYTRGSNNPRRQRPSGPPLGGGYQ